MKYEVRIDRLVIDPGLGVGRDVARLQQGISQALAQRFARDGLPLPQPGPTPAPAATGGPAHATQAAHAAHASGAGAGLEAGIAAAVHQAVKRGATR